MTCCSLPTPESILDDDEIDVFENIIEEGEYFRDEKIGILWSTYRYRSIGCGNIAYWLQCMKDRYAQIVREYDLKIGTWSSLHTKITTDGPDMAESSSEYDQENTREDVPDNATNSTEYLSERTKTHYAGKGYSGLETTTTKQYIDDIPTDALRDFAKEFSRLFYHGL